MTKKLQNMTVEELELFRAEKQAEMQVAKDAFVEAGKILNAKLQATELAEQKADLENQVAEVEAKLTRLGG